MRTEFVSIDQDCFAAHPILQAAVNNDLTSLCNLTIKEVRDNVVSCPRHNLFASLGLATQSQFIQLQSAILYWQVHKNNISAPDVETIGDSIGRAVDILEADELNTVIDRIEATLNKDIERKRVIGHALITLTYLTQAGKIESDQCVKIIKNLSRVGTLAKGIPASACPFSAKEPAFYRLSDLIAEFGQKNPAFVTDKLYINLRQTALYNDLLTSAENNNLKTCFEQNMSESKKAAIDM